MGHEDAVRLEAATATGSPPPADATAASAHENGYDRPLLGRRVPTSLSAGGLSRGSSVMSDLFAQLRELDVEEEMRIGGVKSSVYTLVSTMMGGGVLSLPYAMQEAGLALGPVLLLLVGVASRHSLWLVITTGCSVGAASYEDMVCRTLGRRAGILVTAILVVLTWFVIVAYSILLGDLLGTVLDFCFPETGVALRMRHGVVTFRTLAMAGGHLAVLPVTRLPSINSMRIISAVSIATTMMLAVLISARSIAAMYARGYVVASGALTSLWPRSGVGVLNAVSIVSVSFLCHFNLLPISGELRRPTKRRFAKVVDRATAVAGALYVCVGVLGCAQFLDSPTGVRGNILNNYNADDAAITVGRLALALTVSIGIALMVHPCRSAMRTLLASPCCEHGEVAAPGASPPAAAPGAEMEAVASRPQACLRDTAEALLIQGTGLTAAVFIPEITLVWSLMGSTVAMLIAFVLPSACYLGLRRWDRQTALRKWVSAWVLVVAGLVLTLVCSFCAVAKYVVRRQ